MSTQDKLLFRKGKLADLTAATIVPGSINFTIDEPGIYLDVTDDKGTAVRRRVGDIIMVEDIQGLFATDDKGNIIYDESNPTDVAKALPNWSTTALYYVKSENALLRWGGTDNPKWVRLNPSLESTTDNITALSTALSTLTDNYDAFVKTTYPKDKEALEKSIEDNKDANEATQSEVDALDQRITTLNTTYTDTFETKLDAASKLDEAKEYTDDLAEGAVATNATNIAGEISRATSKENDLQGQITALSETVTTNNTTTSNLIDDLEEKDTQLEAAITSGNSTTLKDANKYTDGKVAAINTEINGVKSSVASLSTTTSNLISALQTKDTQLEAAITSGNSTTLDAAKGYTNDEVAKINIEINGVKGSVASLNTNLSDAITQAKKDAINAVTGTANDNSSAKTIYGLKKYIDEEMQTADAMTFKGILDETHSFGKLTETAAGDTYKVAQDGYYDADKGTYSTITAVGIKVYIGDLLIAEKDYEEGDTVISYHHITSGYEDDYNTRLTRYQKWNEETKDYEVQNGIALESIAGIYHGSISFSGDSGTNVIAKVTGEPDGNNIGTMNVELSMVWGSF